MLEIGLLHPIHRLKKSDLQSDVDHHGEFVDSERSGAAAPRHWCKKQAAWNRVRCLRWLGVESVGAMTKMRYILGDRPVLPLPVTRVLATDVRIREKMMKEMLQPKIRKLLFQGGLNVRRLLIPVVPVVFTGERQAQQSLQLVSEILFGSHGLHPT
jgi:hypothetical protein